MKPHQAAIFAYGAGAIITFGHAWSVAGMHIFSVWAAAGWPLYWSVQLWK